jgi:hypothetical protein
LALVAVLISESRAEPLLEPPLPQRHGTSANWGRFEADGWDDRSTLGAGALLGQSSPLGSSANRTENEASFCDSSATMSMFMDGFHSSLVPAAAFEANASSSPTAEQTPERLPSCLAYLAPSLELSSRARFAWAMLATFLLAMALEALSALRCRVHCGPATGKAVRRPRGNRHHQ